ncbi:glycoside hydrolase family 43 protein [Pseudoduganella sp. RAF53_2]|uniref:glycoside hydrolase family 43 protein n=1 Tax=unclassified Pseudoduganella TaxID=2637179 RepID=UPI003F954F28
MKRLLCALVFAFTACAGAAEYRNPVLHADYSDPDAIRVGQTYYMTASSFNSAPGLPLLESRDMAHWELVGHALPQLVPLEMFEKPQHGKGVWAPALRHHDGKFWIFYPDPDQGIFVTTATNFRGPWSAPHLLLPGKGIIDPAPLWDDDGNAYLIHAWARSRAGINNILTLRSMAPDASRLLDDQGKTIIDGGAYTGYHTLEGPKLYKARGYYYVFAPVGGVEYGWQSVFRSRSIEGPYEARIVMAQGSSNTNGPHQGAWVKTQEGSDWFYHFQHKGAYGRIVHLQPMRWQDDWPVIGEANPGNITGQPVQSYEQPVPGKLAVVAPPTSDDFSQPALGLQWQWNANWKPDWYSLTARRGYLRLYGQQPDNLWNLPSMLLQKLPAERFTTTTRVDLRGLADGASAGLVMYGMDYAWLGVRRKDGTNTLVLASCLGAMTGCEEKTQASAPLSAATLSLRMKVEEGGRTQFSYSADGKRFTPIGAPFIAAAGRWVGARIGLFSIGPGYLDVADFNVRRINDPPTSGFVGRIIDPPASGAD